MDSHDESLVKSWHSAQFLNEALQEAHAAAGREAEEMILSDMIVQVSTIEQRLKRMALEGNGNEE